MLADIGRGLAVLHLLAEGGMGFGQSLAGADHQQQPVGKAAAQDRRDEILRLEELLHAG